MTCLQTIPTPFRLSGRVLRGPVSTEFESFYRATLRYQSGGRLRVLDVAELYRAWAIENDAPGMGAKQLRRVMMNIGHRHFRSNITLFGDVVLASKAPSIADNFPRLPNQQDIEAERRDSLLGKFDAAMAELAGLRAALVAGQQ